MQGNRDLIIFALFKVLEIRQCIRITENSISLPNVNFYKNSGMRNVPTVFFSQSELLEFAKKEIASYWSTAIIIEGTTLDNIRELLNLFNDSGIRHEIAKFSWIVFLDVTGKLESEKYQLEVPYNCEFIIIHHTGENAYELLEIYKIKNESFVFHFGTWDVQHGLNIKNISFIDRRSDLSNVSLVFALEVFKPEECKKGRYLVCADRDVFYDFQKILKFNVILINRTTPWSDDNDYADVYDGENFYHTYFYRYDTVAPLYKTYLNWYIKEPQVEARQDYYIHPLSIDMWISTLLTIIIGSVLIATIVHLYARLESKTTFVCLTDDIFSALECFCGQDGGRDRSISSFRIALFTIRIAALIVLSAYSAIIISHLAVRIPKIPFRNFEEFIKNGEYFIIRKDTAPFPQQFFGSNANPVVRQINEKFLKAYPERQGIKMACEGKYAMMAPNIYRKDPPCSFYQVDEPVTFFLTGLGLKKHSELRDIFNYKLIGFYSSGVQSKIQQKLDVVPLKTDNENELRPVRLNQMVQVLSIVPIGIAVGVFIFFLEYLKKSFINLRRWNKLQQMEKIS